MKKFSRLIVALVVMLCACCTTLAESDGWRLVETVFTDASGNTQLRYEHAYDEQGEKCGQICYGAEGEWKNSFTWQTTTRADGKLERVVEKYESADGYAVETVYVYSWDPTGYVAYIDITDDSGSASMSMMAYDDQGRVTEENTDSYMLNFEYHPDRNVKKSYWYSTDQLTYTVTELDGQGRAMEARVYVVNGYVEYAESDMTERTVYEYAGDGPDCTYTVYDANGAVVGVTQKVYDADGHSYTTVSYDASGAQTGGTRYVYADFGE